MRKRWRKGVPIYLAPCVLESSLRNPPPVYSSHFPNPSTARLPGYYLQDSDHCPLSAGSVRGDQYAIALALLDEGRVVLGVLWCPNLPLTSIGNLSFNSSGDQTGATIGFGAEVQSLDGSSPQKISVCTIDNPVNASLFESYEGAHTMRDFTCSIAEKLGVQAPLLRIDSQAKYGALARGDGAIYWRFPDEGYRETIWDHAAGSIVVTEAGGVVKDASGNDLHFSKGRFLDRDTCIIATNKQLMSSVLKSVQDEIKEKNQASSPL